MKRLFTGHFHIDLTLFIIALVVLITVFVFVGQTQAQDATPTPPVDVGNLPPDVPATPSGLIALYTFLAGSTVVTAVTGFVKQFVSEDISADTIKQWVAVAALAVYILLGWSGHKELFGSGANIVEQVAPLLASIVGVLFGSSGLHKLSAKAGLPILGFKRG